MKLTFSLLCVVFTTANLFAQNSKISGTVVDSLTNQPVEFANVALIPSGSTTPVDGTICDDKGEFTLTRVASGSYDVTISFIGFETRVLKAVIGDRREDIDFGRIIISPTPQLLEAVTVEGQKALIEERVDRLVYNAENDITS